MRQILQLLIPAVMCTQLMAAEYQVSDNALFAVVTHKGGAVKSMGHDHFVFAKAFKAKMTYDEKDPTGLTFEITLNTEDLIADDTATSSKWQQALTDYGVLAEAFSVQSEKNQGKIRKAMLSKEQLDVDHFKTIKAQVVSVARKHGTAGGESFAFEVVVALTIKGKTVKQPFMANMNLADGVFTMRALGSFDFTQFGIEPYSALFGAVANQDGFHVLVDLTAQAVE